MGRKPLLDTERVDLRYEWARRMREARESRNLSQRQLALAVGTGQGHISRIEDRNHRPEPELQARIAAVLEYPTFELFPRDHYEAAAGAES